MKVSALHLLALPFRRVTVAALLLLAGTGGAPLVAADVEAPDSPPPRRIELGPGLFQDVQVRSHEIADQVIAIFSNATIDGRVRDQVVVVFGNTTIRNDVGDQVVSVFGTVTVGPGVRIDDQLVVIGGSLNLDPTAEVNGQIIDLTLPRLANIPGLRHVEAWLRDGLFLGRLYPHDARWVWMLIGVLLLFNLVFAALFRGPLDKCVGALERRPALSFINGLLVFVLTPPVVVLLAVSVVGLLALPFLFAAQVFAVILGTIAVFRHCGAQFGLRAHPFAALIVGHALFAALFAVPVIGLLLWNFVMMLGVGSAANALLDARRRETRGHNGHHHPPPPSPPASPSPTDTTASLTPPAAPVPTEAGVPSPVLIAPPPERTAISSPATPATAASGVGVALPRADFRPRLLATALDLVLILATVAFFEIEQTFPYVWLGYHIVLWTWRATTLGGIVLNLRIERLDGRRLDLGIVAVRALGSVLSLLPLGLGFLWVHWDPERQSWHDKIAGTTIVRVPRGVPLV